MLLFQKRFHAPILSGEVGLTYRRWHKPHVRVGGRYRCHPIGVLEVDALSLVGVGDIGDDDARLSGFSSRDELLAYLATGPAGPLVAGEAIYRIAFHHGGDGDRVEVALDADLGPGDVAAIAEKLERLDARGAWTATTLALIEERPRVAASQLAASLGRETAPFKVDVRKLKRLGLTQSFEVGYELSPRGRAYLAAARPKKGRRPTATRRPTAETAAAARKPTAKISPPRSRKRTAAPADGPRPVATAKGRSGKAR